jgi:SNF2 family DNA or RNA helicase
LGKTIQSIALIAALLQKSGTGDDLLKLKRREDLIMEKLAKVNDVHQRALAEGRLYMDPCVGVEDLANDLPEWSPILIIAPKVVTSVWRDALMAWGHFSCSLYQGAERDCALEAVNIGLAEIMICGHSMITRVGDVAKLIQSKPWKLVFVDELHNFKNEDALKSKHLRQLRDAHNSIIIGLTGTVMPNRHDELHSSLDLVADGHFGSWKDFERDYGKPILFSRCEADEIGRLYVYSITWLTSFLFSDLLKPMLRLLP